MDGIFTVSINMLLLIGIWWLYFFGYRSYRLDKTRQSLFAIRDHLFEEWAKLGLPFDSDAYVIMRTTLNGMIRFAHRLSMIRFIAAISADGIYRDGAGAKQYESHLKNALSGVPPEARKVINATRAEMHMVMADHLVKSSLIMRAFLVVVTLFQVANSVMVRLTKRWSATIDAEAENIGHSHCRGISA